MQIEMITVTIIVCIQKQRAIKFASRLLHNTYTRLIFAYCQIVVMAITKLGYADTA